MVEAPPRQVFRPVVLLGPRLWLMEVPQELVQLAFLGQALMVAAPPRPALRPTVLLGLRLWLMEVPRVLVRLVFLGQALAGCGTTATGVFYRLFCWGPPLVDGEVPQELVQLVFLVQVLMVAAPPRPVFLPAVLLGLRL